MTIGFSHVSVYSKTFYRTETNKTIYKQTSICAYINMYMLLSGKNSKQMYYTNTARKVTIFLYKLINLYIMELKSIRLPDSKSFLDGFSFDGWKTFVTVINYSHKMMVIDLRVHTNLARGIHSCWSMWSSKMNRSKYKNIFVDLERCRWKSLFYMKSEYNRI